MTYEELVKANSTINTTDIKGKAYADVNQRIKAFRMLYPNGAITTEMVSNENGVCVFRATIFDDSSNVLGTGTAYEKEGSTFINKTSYIENCETSAVGRALAMCGIGIDTSIASYEEVSNAVANQDQPKPFDTVEYAKKKAQLMKYISTHEYTEEQIQQICKAYKVNELADLQLEQINHYIEQLKAHGKDIEE